MHQQYLFVAFNFCTVKRIWRTVYATSKGFNGAKIWEFVVVLESLIEKYTKQFSDFKEHSIWNTTAISIDLQLTDSCLKSTY